MKRQKPYEYDMKYKTFAWQICFAQSVQFLFFIWTKFILYTTEEYFTKVLDTSATFKH